MCFKTFFNTAETYIVTTQDTPPEKNLYKSKERTNSGKQIIAYRDSIPANLKELNVFNFSKQLKLYLLSEQQFVTL